MKKPIAILLLAVYLFNLAGYSLVFGYFIHRSEQGFIQQLDENKYKDAELVEISIPFNLPYTQNSSSFQRLEGSVELNGITYNYVKRRIYNDTLYIMCLPNRHKTQLIKGKSHYAGEVNDFASNKKEKESTAKKTSFGAEYNNIIPKYGIGSLPATINRKNTFSLLLIPASFPGRPEHPPQFTC